MGKKKTRTRKSCGHCERLEVVQTAECPLRPVRITDAIYSRGLGIFCMKAEGSSRQLQSSQVTVLEKNVKLG